MIIPRHSTLHSTVNVTINNRRHDNSNEYGANRIMALFLFWGVPQLSYDKDAMLSYKVELEYLANAQQFPNCVPSNL